jgi:hypothetical protein
MNIKPAISVQKLSQLSDGDFFFFGLDAGGSCAAIKLTDPDASDGVNVVLLGPDYPDGSDAPTLYWLGDMSVVSYAANYTIQFPTKPSAWAIGGRPPAGVSMFINDGDVYIGGSSNHRVWIANISAGEILGKNQPGGPIAYTNKWEIGIEDGTTFHSIVKGE